MFPALFPGAEINWDPNGCVNGVPREKVNKLQRRYLIKPPVSVSLCKCFLKRVRPRGSTEFLRTASQTIIAKGVWGGANELPKKLHNKQLWGERADSSYVTEGVKNLVLLSQHSNILLWKFVISPLVDWQEEADCLPEITVFFEVPWWLCDNEELQELLWVNRSNLRFLFGKSSKH